MRLPNFGEILSIDQTVAESRLSQMQNNGLLSLFDSMLELLNDFTAELESHTSTQMRKEYSQEPKVEDLPHIGWQSQSVAGKP